MWLPLSRVVFGLAGSRGSRTNCQLPILSPPTKNQDPYHLDYELPLDGSRSLLFFTFNGTPIVQVVRREPKPKNPRTHRPSVISLFLWLGLIARELRARLKNPRCSVPLRLADTHNLARFFLPSPGQSNRVLRSLAAHSLPRRTSGVIRRPFHILTSLLVAAREAMSLGRRIG